MDKKFYTELEDTLYLHRPLPLHEEQTAEAAFYKKKVLNRCYLYGKDERMAAPEAPREATIQEKDGTITMRASLRSDHWPQGAAPDGDYSNFGTAAVRFRMAAQNWEQYSRLRFRVRPLLRGARIAHINVSVKNEGRITIPDTMYELRDPRICDEVYREITAPRMNPTSMIFDWSLLGEDDK